MWDTLLSLFIIIILLICLTKLSNTCRQTQVQAGVSEASPPACNIIITHKNHSDMLGEVYLSR